MLTAIILGGADCWLEDEARARDMFVPDLVIACNAAGKDYPGQVDHWASLHPVLFPRWVRDRKKKGLPEAAFLWCPWNRNERWGLTMQRCHSWNGSSGLFACAVACHLNVTHGVLCGIPLTAEAAHFDNKAPWKPATTFRGAWLAQQERLRGRIKSMGGWTQELLGAPTAEWFKGERQ